MNPVNVITCKRVRRMEWGLSVNARIGVRRAVNDRTSPCSAFYVTLLTFLHLLIAAILMCAVLRGARRCWSISPACRAPSSKPAAHCCSGRQMGKTDGRTPDRISAAHSMRAVWITCDDYFWYRFGSGGDINTLHGFTFWQPSVLWRCWLGGQELSVRPVKIEWWGVGVVTCLERGADCLHMDDMVQLTPLPSPNPIISCLI